MKKLVLVFGAFIVLFTYFSMNVRGLLANSDIKDCNVGVYASGKDCKKVFDNCFSHGFANEIFGITPEIFYSYRGDGEILGEFFETKPENFNLNKFSQKFGLIVTHTSIIDGTKNIYAKSALLPYALEGEEFNVQISISNDLVTVASPIIMGSF